MAAEQIIKRTYAPAALVGQVYARVYGADGPLLEIGNVLGLTVEHAESIETQPDLSRAGGGVHAERRRVSDVKISMTLADLNVVNLSRAVLGSVRGVDAGSVEVGNWRAARGALLPLEYIGASNVTVRKNVTVQTVTDERHDNVNPGDAVTLAHAGARHVQVRIGADSGSAVPLTMAGNYTVTPTGLAIEGGAPDVPSSSTLWVSYEYSTAGVEVPQAGNYEVRAAGLWVLPDARDIADGDVLAVRYQYVDQAVIEALTSSATELQLLFEGINEADSGKPVVVDIWRASQGVASSIALMQESGFAGLQVTGAVLQDSSRQGAGISKYYRVRKT